MEIIQTAAMLRIETSCRKFRYNTIIPSSAGDVVENLLHELERALCLFQ